MNQGRCGSTKPYVNSNTPRKPANPGPKRARMERVDVFMRDHGIGCVGDARARLLILITRRVAAQSPQTILASVLAMAGPYIR